MKGVDLFDPINFEVENSMYTNSEGALNQVVMNMIRDISNPVDRLIFVCHFLNHNELQYIAEVLCIHPTNVSRRMKRIRKQLTKYTVGYSFLLPPVKYRHKPKDN